MVLGVCLLESESGDSRTWKSLVVVGYLYKGEFCYRFSLSVEVGPRIQAQDWRLAGFGYESTSWWRRPSSLRRGLGSGVNVLESLSEGDVAIEFSVAVI